MLVEYVECKKCLYNSFHDKELKVDENGICNHCNEYHRNQKFIKDLPLNSPEIKKKVEQIKKQSKGRKYDCLIGLSGGVDSSYLAIKVKELGLNPLAVHFDNGWNSELAIINIENIVKKLSIDLYSYIVDWDEFKDLQLAYFKASVVDIELVTDHAINAVMFKVAKKFKIKYIISGENYKTEGVLPSTWVYNKSDHINIKAIHEKFGVVELKTFPFLGFFTQIFWEKIYGFKYWRLLDEIEYDKEYAKNELKLKLGWRDYGGKHYESVFTRFYQAYILPRKFGIDKRISHYSTLICAGQLSKIEALDLMDQNICDPKILVEDKHYIIKKFKLTSDSFDEIMKLPIRNHTFYRNINSIFQFLRPFKRVIRIFIKI